MTNSLFKDSHIALQLYRPDLYSGRGLNNKKKRQEYSNLTVSKNIGISVNKPADKINFRGFISAKVANDNQFLEFFTKVKDSLGDKVKLKAIKNLFNYSGGELGIIKKGENKSTISEAAKSFADSNKDGFLSIFKKVEEFVKSDSKKPLKPDELPKKIKEVMDAALDGAMALTHKGKPQIFTKKYLKKALLFAEENPVVYDAIFALGLVCVLRPATIMALPGDKKNKDDKKYAAAHSIASGVIAYLMSLVLFSPIAKAMEKVKNSIKTKKFITNTKNYLREEGSEKALNAASVIVKKIPEAILAPFRAMVTIALIPIILKNVFGLEKGKKTDNKKGTAISQNYAAINHNSPKNKNIVQSDVKKGGVK